MFRIGRKDLAIETMIVNIKLKSISASAQNRLKHIGENSDKEVCHALGNLRYSSHSVVVGFYKRHGRQPGAFVDRHRSNNLDLQSVQRAPVRGLKRSITQSLRRHRVNGIGEAGSISSIGG